MQRHYLAFGYAWNGIRVAWREEKYFKLDVVVAVLILLASWIFQISRTEFLIVLVTIGIVMMAEIFNTAFEELCDKFNPSPDPHIAKIKDLAAAGVLVAGAVALVVGLIIFWPYIVELL